MKNLVVCMLVGSLIACCPQNGKDGVSGVSGSNGHNSLVGSIAVDTTVCPALGFAVNSGLDKNDNNVLDLSEITSTAVVCNGVNGSTPAFSVTSTIAPCTAASSPYKEELLCLNNGNVLASFSDNASGLNTRLSLLPAGTFTDTDNSGCSFAVTIALSGSTTVSYGAGSNAYATWSANSITCIAH